ncbi:MAG: hypothetical protein WC648_02360 [Candidatus Paceibacterota bacterium]|jgi:hypothetical protein
MMIKFLLILAVIPFIFVTPDNSFAGETNTLSKSFVAIKAPKLNIGTNDTTVTKVKWSIETTESKDVFRLPLEDRMDFDSYTEFSGAKNGRDIWNWRLIRVTKRSGIGPFVSADYPVTMTGPNRDTLSTGIAFGAIIGR